MANKCVICNRTFEGNACPRDGFPVIHIVGDYEEGLKKNKSNIEAYRNNFFSKITLGVSVYYWKDENGKIVLDKERSIPFGSAAELYGRSRWLEEDFARIPDAEKLIVSMYIDSEDGEKKTKEIELPNLSEPELQQIGICMKEDFGFKLMLRNKTGKPTESKEYSIFD